jgi:hypothetical protein
MMARGDYGGHLQHRRAAAGEHTSAGLGMPLHHLTLVVGERAGLEQNAIWDGELADVVQRGSFTNELDLLRVESELGGDLCRSRPHALRVLEGLIVAVLAGARQPLQGLSAGIVQLARSLSDVVGVDELDERPRAHLLAGVAEGRFPRRVDAREATCRVRCRQQVERRVEVPQEFGFESASLIYEGPEEYADQDERDATAQVAEDGHRRVLVDEVP